MTPPPASLACGRRLEWSLTGGAIVWATGCSEGDLAGCSERVAARRRAVVDLPWTVLRQVHGARVVTVEVPGGATGEAADAAVSKVSGAALAVLSADCAPVAMSSPEGVFAIAHAGWRGLRAGVVEATVQAMRRLGATRVEAVLGPCVHPCCYPFGAADLESVVERLGSSVRSLDRAGRSALDIPAAVRVALHSVGASLVGDAATCTACSSSYWSARAGAGERRQATVVWRT
jgi:YfiH family protein